MYCPLCGAEYREGFTVCSDCQVDLVADPPRAASAEAAMDAASFVLVWSGNDPRQHADVCEALDHQKIAARTLRREDHFFNPTMHPDFEIYVPADLRDSARQAIHQAVPTDDDSEEPSDSDQLLDSGILEIPAEDGPSNDEYDDDHDRGGPQNLDPQDATVEIWSGQDADLAAMIASSLRENDVVFRSDPDTTEPESGADETRPTRILVFPEDEKRAKEIVREIVDAVPPE